MDDSGVSNLILRQTLASDENGGDDDSPTAPVAPIDKKERRRLRATAIARHIWEPLTKLSLVAAGVAIAALHEEVLVTLKGLASDIGLGPAAAIAIILFVALFFFGGARVTYWAYWKYWLDVRAKSNDSYVKVKALLHVTETYALFQNYGTRCVIVSVLGYLLFVKLFLEGQMNVAGVEQVAMGMILLLSTTLLWLAINFQTLRLGGILIENLLFIAVQAEAAPIANEDVYEDMSTRLLPKFQRKRPEHFY